MLQIKDAETTWSCISHSLHSSQSCRIRVEALRFLARLSRSPSLSGSIGSLQFEAICRGIVEAIAEGLLVQKERWPPDIEVLVLEAAHAARALLCWSGDHQLLFWRAGIVEVLSNLLIQKHDNEISELSQDTDYVVNPKPLKYDQIIWPLLWDILGWLATHAGSFLELSFAANRTQEMACTRLLEFACDMMLKVVNRKGQSQVSMKMKQLPGGISNTGLAGVFICKTVLLLLTSQSGFISTHTRYGLEKALKQHGYDWLPSLARKLSLKFSSVAPSDDLVTLVNLMSVASLSFIKDCRSQLQQEGMLEVLAEAIKMHSSRMVVHEPTGVRIFLASSFDAYACCWDHKYVWEGHDPILFYSLWAFASMARGSKFAREAHEALEKKMSSNLEWKGMQDGSFESHLLRLAGDTDTAAGLRWWASCCLACCGMYGFPAWGKCLKRVFNDPFSADVVLMFSDGSKLLAHKVILAIECPALLPSTFHVESGQDRDPTIPSEMKCVTCPVSGTSECRSILPLELHLSARLRQGPVTALLEYIYKGAVLIEDEMVAEVKLLAKRCKLGLFLRFLQGKPPVWGDHPAPCEFTSALENMGAPFFDIALQGKDGGEVSCSNCALSVAHVHAHRVLLASRCSYFEALFRSGMQDSLRKVIMVPMRLDSLRKFLLYLYSGSLPHLRLPEAGCMWSSLDRAEQVQYLESYVELAQIAEQWLLEDLWHQCLTVVQKQLKQSLYLGPEVIRCAALCNQWVFVERTAWCVASEYPRMRDSGELNELDDALIDIVRVAHVKISMESSE